MPGLTLSNVPPNFDELEYLRANPDVAEAVKRGSVKSGLEHYRRWGKDEGRPLHSANRHMASGLQLNKLRGLEIGALARPIVRKSDGDITYVDYADRTFLRTRYEKDPKINIDEIVETDAIWGHRTLLEAVSPKTDFDYVLAAHVVEHVPDLLSWLNEISDVLSNSGVLRLAIPDKRYCFDFLRDETKIADILDAYLRKARVPTPRAILDFCINMRDVDTLALWNGGVKPNTLNRPYSTEGAIGIARESLQGIYHDVHCWVFTPHSFCRLMAELCEIKLLRLGCDFITPTEKNSLEFFVSMSKAASSEVAEKSWRSAEIFQHTA